MPSHQARVACHLTTAVPRVDGFAGVAVVPCADRWPAGHNHPLNTNLGLDSVVVDCGRPETLPRTPLRPILAAPNGLLYFAIVQADVANSLQRNGFACGRNLNRHLSVPWDVGSSVLCGV